MGNKIAGRIHCYFISDYCCNFTGTVMPGRLHPRNARSYLHDKYCFLKSIKPEYLHLHQTTTHTCFPTLSLCMSIRFSFLFCIDVPPFGTQFTFWLVFPHVLLTVLKCPFPPHCFIKYIYIDKQRASSDMRLSLISEH